MQADKVVNRMRLSFKTLMAIGTDDTISGTPCLVLNTVKHGSIVVGDKVRHHHANHFRGFLTKTLGKRVWAIIQFLGQILHTLLHVLTNLRRTAQGSADSCNTDP